VDVPGNRLVRREGDSLVIVERGKLMRPKSYSVLLLPGKELSVGEGAYSVILSPLQKWQGSLEQARSHNPWFALFDGDAVRDGVLVRNFRPGDRVRPLGLGGHKKVHDVFIDVKVPAALRPTWPLVVIDSEIAWVPGCVRGEIAKITAMTRWVCQGTVIPLPGK
jgi:tRNA(Ile)-lysidine synthetase-like protein